MSKHTPGPWWATKDKDARGWHGWRIDSDSRALMAWAAWPSEEERDSLEAESTARLIAAAPELLAALIGAEKCIAASLTHLPPEGPNGFDIYSFCGEWLGEVRETIAKARGE